MTDETKGGHYVPEVTTELTKEQEVLEAIRFNLRTVVRGAYDLQQTRIQIGNRVARNFTSRLGQESGKKASELSDEAKQILSDIKKQHKRLTDGLTRLSRDHIEMRIVKAIEEAEEGKPIISDYAQFVLVDSYFTSLAGEERMFKQLERILTDFPIYNDFLKGVKGCGPQMSGILISEINIFMTPTVSALWKLTGYDVAPDGKGRSRRKEHLIDREYVNKEGKKDTKKSITFNPTLKTKLHVLAACLLKAASPYREYYDNYKHRIENMEAHEEKTKGHRHAMALRYMIKMFLMDFFSAWRGIEKLPVRGSYHEEILGHKHHAA